MMSLQVLAELANLLLLPATGLLWRLSTQIAAIQAMQAEHARRLGELERAK